MQNTLFIEAPLTCTQSPTSLIVCFHRIFLISILLFLAIYLIFSRFIVINNLLMYLIFLRFFCIFSICIYINIIIYIIFIWLIRFLLVNILTISLSCVAINVIITLVSFIFCRLWIILNIRF